MTHREDIWRGPHDRNTPEPSHAAKNEPHNSPEIIIIIIIAFQV